LSPQETAGQKFRNVREKLGLQYRDVEEASHQIAARLRNEEFAILISRLSDIEHRGTVPSIYRLYTLSAVYKLDYGEILRWYGVPGPDFGHDSGTNENGFRM